MKKDKTRKKSSAYKKYRRHKILFITELIILIPLLVFGFLYVQFEKRLGNIDTVNIQSGDIQVNEEVENNAVLHGYTTLPCSVLIPVTEVWIIQTPIRSSLRASITTRKW